MCRRRVVFIFFFSSRRRHTRCSRDWISDVCSSDLTQLRCAAGERPTATVRRDVVAHSLFGVDLKLTAVRLAELRLWLALVADQDERSEEHTSELQSRLHLVCRLLLEKKKKHTDCIV